MAKSYYKTIQGVRYDRALLEAAEERIYGQGDRRISKKDAEEIVELSKDGGRITETELRTLKYISENYHFIRPGSAAHSTAAGTWSSFISSSGTGSID